MFTVSVTGLREVTRSLERMGVEVSDLKAAFKRIGDMVAGDARSLAPVLTGRLSGTIRSSNAKNKAVVRAGGGLVYAGVIHYGGYNNIEPHPFLTTAAAQNQNNVVRELDQELNSLIRRLDLT